jgi:hypothetical protein
MILTAILAFLLSAQIWPLFPTAVIGGLLFGRFYNKKLGLSNSLIYHKVIAGWAFLIFWTIFRGFVASVSIPPLMLIMFVWGLFCLCIYLGNKIPWVRVGDRKF